MIDGLLRRAATFWVVAVLVTTVGGGLLGPLLAGVVLVIGAVWCVVYVLVQTTPEWRPPS